MHSCMLFCMYMPQLLYKIRFFVLSCDHENARPREILFVNKLVQVWYLLYLHLTQLFDC